MIAALTQHARLSVELGLPVEYCPFDKGTSNAKKWIAAYLMAEVDREDQRQPVATFSGGACEQLEVA